MIIYFANRSMEIQGSASTGLPGGFTIVEDNKTEEIETGVAVFECRVKFNSENRLRLDYLPADCQLLGGDLVVTSGLGGYYPSGLSVGTVEEVQLSDSGAASYAVLEPAADFDSLVEVFVIKSFDIQT